jgi:hypothetical protein
VFLLQVYENGLKELQTMKDQLDGDHGDIVDETTALVRSLLRKI